MDLEERLDRFGRGAQKVIDLKNIATEHASRNGWSSAFDALANDKFQIVADGKTKEIDFAAHRKYNYLADDVTNFRPYFTLLFVLNALSHRVTPHTLAHHTSISVQGVYGCLDKLAREGFVEKLSICKMPEYVQVRAKAKGARKALNALESEKNALLAAVREQFQETTDHLKAQHTQFETTTLKPYEDLYTQIANTLGVFDSAHLPVLYIAWHAKRDTEFANIQHLLEEKAREIETEYNAKKASIDLNEDEKALLSRAKPRNYYVMSEQGKNFLELVKNKHPIAWKNFSELFATISTGLNSLTLASKPLSLINILHMPEEELEQSYGLFKNLLISWNKLPETATLLFGLCEKPFKVGAIEKELTYIGDGAPFAHVYLDPQTDELYAAFENKTKPIGQLTLGKEQREKFLAQLSTQDKNKFYNVLNCAIRWGQLELANEKAETDCCKKLGIWYESSGIKTFHTEGNVAGLKLYNSEEVIGLENFTGVVFLPRSFDSKGISYKT